MTCLLNTYGLISNVKQLIQYLNDKEQGIVAASLPIESIESKNQKIDHWNWNDKDEPISNDTKENWFDKYIIRFSPYGNLIIIASDRNIVICTGKNATNDQMKFTVVSRIELIETDESITSIAIIPIASQKATAEGQPDLTVIMVGLNTGNLKMYTENGTLLITQMFHDTQVLRIKCRSHEPAKYIGWVAQPEEVEILYDGNVLVCLDALNLINYLKTVRRYTISGNHETSEMIASLSLDYKKWKLNNHDTMNDFVSAGLTSENRFDQLFSASMVGGPNERFESIAPISNRFITTGANPYVNFYNAIEGLSSPGFFEVKAAAGKVTSALMNAAKGWIGFGKSQAQTNVKQKPKIEPPTSLPARFGLRDSRRCGETIIVSPGNNLAATTDSFGRVLLIDIFKGIVIRIFKGYRDAQIGWISVNDDTSTDTKRYALYLIIYAPRRGLLEVWGCQQGIRVCAFNVGKNSKLIYPGYYMLSLNGSLYNDQMEANKKYQCFIVNSEGVIKVLTIPFHLILSDKSNQKVRDTILLKKIKAILREETQESDSLWNSLTMIIKEFKTASIKQQALERMLSVSYLSPNKLLTVLEDQLKQLDRQGDNQSQESHKLGQFCRFNSKLIHSYIFISESNVKCLEEKEIETKDEEETIKNLNELTQIEENELKNYLQMKKFISERSPIEKKVKFLNEADKSLVTLHKYITSFELIANSQTNDEKDYSKQKYFDLNKNMTFKDKEALGSFLFSGFLYKNCEFTQINMKEFLNLVPLKKIQLLDLLIYGWLSQSFENVTNLYKLVVVLSGFSNFASNSESRSPSPVETVCSEVFGFNTDEQIDETDFENNFISEYLPKFKTICESSTSLIYSLLISCMFRSILIQSQVETNQVETLRILSDRLFCLIKLYSLVLIGKKTILSESFEKSSYSLKTILKKSKGFLSDFLAKHIVLNEYPPKLLTIIDDDEDEEDENGVKTSGILLLQDERFKEFYTCLQETRKYLPKSLEADTLLANSAWEAMVLFNKSFEANIECLELSLRYCGEIGNAIVRQGILSMIWHYNLSKRLQLLADLIEKVGKTPKDRQLRKEAGLSEENVIKFLDCIMAALDLIMDANCNINEVPIFNYDQFWNDSTELGDIGTISTNMYLNLSLGNQTRTEKSNDSSSHNGSKQLVELAAEQKHVNYHLCLFHYQLVRILYLVIKYNIKPVKVFSFFDTKGKHTLFSELHTHPLISNDVDIKIMNARKFFLIKAMNSIMENVENPTSIKSKLAKEVNDIIETVFTLSKDMGVDLEYIKRNYCCNLYALDYHSEAEKILHTIKERELMASQLLVVVGHKVNEILNSNFDANLHAILSTNLASWLKSLGPPEYKIFTIKSKSSLLDLMGSVLNSMPETFSEHKLAAELFEFIDQSRILE